MMDDIIRRVAGLSCFADPTEIALLGGGLTNVNLSLRDGNKRYVVRLGEDIPEHGVMRWNELALSIAASAAGVSPAVVHHEKGVLVLEFLAAETFKQSDVCSAENLPRIVSLIAQAHRGVGAHLAQPALAFWPFQVNRMYLARLLADGSSHQAVLPQLQAQNTMLEAAAGKVDLVPCHNDLLAANILDDGARLWLIDWEYGGFNSPLFDLAGLASNNGLSDAQERAMLEQYFDTAAEVHWRSYSAMKCASLMRETLWSMTSEIHSKLDEDFGAYTEENHDRLALALADFAQS
ncbi:MAG: phosphotransferase [Sulfitobacter sp.]